MATNLSEANGPDDKLRMAFKMYDKDSSGNVSISKRPFTTIILKMTENAPSYFTAGTIEIAEMTEIVVNLFELEGIEKVERIHPENFFMAAFKGDSCFESEEYFQPTRREWRW